MSVNPYLRNNTAEFAAPYILDSVERTAKMQKQYIDLAAGQLKQVLAVNRHFVGLLASPISFFIDAAERSIQKGVEVQKSLIDSAVEQSRAAVRVSNLADLSEISEELRSLVRTSMEKATATQKEIFDFALEETRRATAFAGNKVEEVALVVAEPVEKPAIILDPAPPTVAAQNFKKNLGAIVDVQKTVVDVAAKPAKSDNRK